VPDMRDIPFRTKSLGPSSAASGPNEGGTQAFRVQGKPGKGKTFADAAADINEMALRLTGLSKTVAEQAIDIMRRNVIKYIEHPAGNFHGYSTGRLAATIGRWEPDLIVQSESGAHDEEMAVEWAAANGVADGGSDSYEEFTIIENGAYSSVKRTRGNSFSAEMGTYTPYAALVEDGGEMEISAYGGKGSIIAHWDANHMFKKGLFDSMPEIQQAIDAELAAIMK
jgi:hypothetical protein